MKLLAYLPEEDRTFKIWKVYWTAGDKISFIMDKSGNLYRGEDIEIKQYVGKKDKNEEELFTGDIVKKDKEEYQVVLYPMIKKGKKLTRLKGGKTKKIN